MTEKTVDGVTYRQAKPPNPENICFGCAARTSISLCLELGDCLGPEVREDVIWLKVTA